MVWTGGGRGQVYHIFGRNSTVNTISKLKLYKFLIEFYLLMLSILKIRKGEQSTQKALCVLISKVMVCDLKANLLEVRIDIEIIEYEY